MFPIRLLVIGRVPAFKRAVLTPLQTAWIASSANRLQTKIIVESSIQPRIEVPQHPVVDYVWKDVCVWEDKPCITCAVTEDTLSYGEARRLIHAFARFFIGTLGLEKGDVVSLIGYNSPLYATIIEGVLEAGLVISFANPIYTNDEILHHLQTCNAKIVIADPQILEVISSMVEQQLPDVQAILPLDDSLRPLAAKAAATEGIELPRVYPEDLAALPFSSGTTGFPKAVMLTHANITSNLRMFVNPSFATSRPTSGDVQDIFFNLLPLYHIFGLQSIWHHSVMTGQHLLVIPNFTSDAFLTTLRKYKPTGLAVVPSIIHMMVTQPTITREDLASIDFVITGGAACTAAYIKALGRKAGRRMDIRQGYGLTESAPAATYNPRFQLTDKAGSVGQPVPGCQIRVLDTETGQDCGPRQTGEILLKGPHIMRGYKGDEEATAETLDSEGWFHTGDIGYYDEDEYFYITDRVKDIFKVKGLQVSPAELENVIMELPEIEDTAIVGIPDERFGELPLAFVVAKPGENIDPEAVIEHVKSRVAPHKQLAAGVKILRCIPRNATGKILRKELQELAV